MKSALYRYPHPYDSDKFIYVGQVWDATRIYKRDKTHRLGKEGFGRRFKRRFPDALLPQPVYEFVDVQDYLELNELETIWMFRFHTWKRGYPDGENLTLPGSSDYKTSAHLAGLIGGRIAVESGHLNRIRTPEVSSQGGKIGGKISGRMNVENGHIQALGRKMTSSFSSEYLSEIGKKGGTVSKNRGAGVFAPGVASAGGRKRAESGQLKDMGDVSRCVRWNIKRNKPCVCGKHLVL